VGSQIRRVLQNNIQDNKYFELINVLYLKIRSAETHTCIVAFKFGQLAFPSGLGDYCTASVGIKTRSSGLWKLKGKTIDFIIDYYKINGKTIRDPVTACIQTWSDQAHQSTFTPICFSN